GPVCYVEFVASALQTDSLLHSHPIIVPGLSDPNENRVNVRRHQLLQKQRLDPHAGRRQSAGGTLRREASSIYLNGSWCLVEKPAVTREVIGGSPDVCCARGARGASGAGLHARERRLRTARANSPVRNLTRVMDTWTTQVNYPLVTVRIRGNKLHFRQERFLLVAQRYQHLEPPFGFRWIVPIRVRVTDQISEPRWVWMDLEEEKTIELDARAEIREINFNQTGLYRCCSYEQSNWPRSGPPERRLHSCLHQPAEHLRAHIELFETLQDDHLSSATPWSIAMHKISEIGPMIVRGPQQAMTRSVQIHLLSGRPLNQIAVMVDEPLVTNKLFKMYQQWRANTSFPTKSNLSMRLASTTGNTSDWQFFKNRLNEIESYSEASTVCSALAMSSDVDTNYRYPASSRTETCSRVGAAPYQSLESVKAKH
uniref:Ig-like domain-containing protein n=1 Tax=Macrostomum lignano TaxID=282301 RepID=A0A1I8FPA8_9PLAT